MKCLFSGVGVALVTPFSHNKIDFDSMQKLIETCITQGADAIVALATTGEAPNISIAERKEIILFCKKVIADRAKLIVGTGHNNFSICKKLTRQAKELGADGCLVVTPYYNKTTQQGLIKYYQELSKIKLPIIMYNVPARTGLCIDLSTVEKIVETNAYVYGIKESTTDINRIIKLHEICDSKIAIYSGEDDLNFLFYCLGGDGTISVTANAFCQRVKNIYSLCKNGSFFHARKQQKELAKINSLMFCETNPVPIKYTLEKLNIITNSEVRLPLVPLEQPHKNQIEQEIKRL